MKKLEKGENTLAEVYLQKLFELVKDPNYSSRDIFKPNVLAGCCFIQ